MSIVVHALAYAHPNREVLFQHLSLSVAKGQKAALVGPNGVGKSTLLQVVAGRLAPAEGEVVLPETPYYVPQHLGQFDNLTLAQALGVADKLQALHAILAGDAAPQHFITLNDDWDLEERTQAALAHWQLQHLTLSQPLHTLSGGEKTKAFLAGIQLHDPVVVLLDEPSNHLDTASRALLYELIQRSKATLLVVSHDRALLNQLDLTLELSGQGVEAYGGNYDFYQQQKQGQLAALQAQVDEQEKALKQARQKARDLAEQRHKLEARGRAQQDKKGLPRIVAGNLRRQAEQSSAQLKEVHQDKIQDASASLQQLRSQLQEQKPLAIGLHASGLHRGKILVEAQALGFAYDGAFLWPELLTFQLRSGERLRIAGPNGSGKTTLLKLLTGTLLPTTGTLSRADFQFLYLDQEYSLINPDLTVFGQAQQFNARHLPEHELKTLLHYHQFGHPTWDRPCAGLSGGEKMKLILACLAISNNTPDLLVLDEPTNNLDLPSQAVLTQAVKAFPGSILVISHDEYFVREIGVERTIALHQVSGALKA